MSAFYDRMTATASKLIQQYGAPATLKRRTAGEYDTDLGAAPITETEFGTTAVVIDYPAKMVDGVIIQRGDRQVYMKSLSTTPTIADLFTWSTVDYNVISVKPLAPAGGTPVMFTLQIRGT